jgi:hypothetical protein
VTEEKEHKTHPYWRQFGKVLEKVSAKAEESEHGLECAAGAETASAMGVTRVEQRGPATWVLLVQGLGFPEAMG